MESVPVTTWHLQMPLEYDRDGKVIHWIEGSRNFSTREAAEFALISTKRTMDACGFAVDFNLVQENPYAEEFIQNKKTCNHHFTEKVGLFYKEHLSQYRNCFDNVEVFMRYQCCKCGEYKDVLLGHQQFCPEMFYDDTEKKQYIKRIRSQGFVMEYELMLREFKKE